MEGVEVAVTDVRDVGARTVALELEAPPDFDARPGRFVQVRAVVDGEEVTRHYSISSPRVEDTFEITVGVDPEGRLSPRLARASAGDAVEVDGPFGRVYYEDEASVALVAEGPGIGAAVGVAERARAAGNEAALVYRTDALVHERRLARLAADGVTVRVVGDAETLPAALAEVLADHQVYVYGFAPFVEAAEAAVEAAGGDPAAAKVENFG